MSQPKNCEYSQELDDEIKLVLEEYRDGKISVNTLLKLIDICCRDHMEQRIAKYKQ